MRQEGQGLGLVMACHPDQKEEDCQCSERWQRPSEARFESGLTRKDIHGIAMVIPSYEKISQRYLDFSVLRYPKQIYLS